MTPPLQLLILDANVLIDLISADAHLLRQLARHLGTVHVLDIVLDEVNEIEDESHARALGLEIIESEQEDISTAIADTASPVSFQDRMCLLSAKRYTYTCVTNDKKLRSLCTEQGVCIVWGLELLLNLASTGTVKKERLARAGKKIQQMNPLYIKKSILDEFLRELDSI